MQPVIHSPSKPIDHPDAQIDCESMIDIPVRDFIDQLIQSGWSPDVVFAAMRSVVDNQAMAYAEDPDPADDPATAP